jgi:hypothetical protein
MPFERSRASLLPCPLGNVPYACFFCLFNHALEGKKASLYVMIRQCSPQKTVLPLQVFAKKQSKLPRILCFEIELRSDHDKTPIHHLSGCIQKAVSMCECVHGTELLADHDKAMPLYIHHLAVEFEDEFSLCARV